MGRTLDTLKHGDTHRADPAPARTAAQGEAGTGDCVMDWTLQTEVPFVEVGGPGRNVECSPLLHPPQPAFQPPHPSLSNGKATAVNLTESSPMAVTFETWPQPATAAGLASEIVAHHQPGHAVSQQYATLWTRMQSGHTDATSRALLLCGLRPHVGTTTVLLNLAVIAAQQKKRVVLIDMNLAQPALASRLGHASLAGISDVLAGSTALSQALAPTAIAGLHLVPAGAAIARGAPPTGEAICWLLGWLRERFDVLLIDGPSVEPATGLAGLVASADDTFLVLPQEEPAGASRGIAGSIARMGGRLRGLIHTHFAP